MVVAVVREAEEAREELGLALARWGVVCLVFTWDSKQFNFFPFISSSQAG